MSWQHLVLGHIYKLFYKTHSLHEGSLKVSQARCF